MAPNITLGPPGLDGQPTLIFTLPDGTTVNSAELKERLNQAGQPNTYMPFGTLPIPAQQSTQGGGGNEGGPFPVGPNNDYTKGDTRPPETKNPSPPIDSTGPATDSFGRVIDLLQNELGNTNVINERLTDPDYINKLRDADAGRRRQEADYLANIGMAKMRENTVRQRELATINAWQNITRAQFDKEAKLGAALTQAAYLANTPNAGVMSSINSIANTSAQGFKAGGSVI